MGGRYDNKNYLLKQTLNVHYIYDKNTQLLWDVVFNRMAPDNAHSGKKTNSQSCIS